MPKYLLQQVGPDADLTFVRASEAWLDGYTIAERQLEGHPIKITQSPDLRFSVSLNLPSWMRLAGRNLRQDAIDYVESGADGMSSTEDLSDDACLVYDTDRPWAQNDPIIIADDGSRAALLPTTPRPQPQAAAGAAQSGSASQAGVPDQQVQNILIGQGLSPLPAGPAAVQALAALQPWLDAKSRLAADPDYEEEAEDDPRNFVSQIAIECGFVPVETTGLDALINDLGLTGVSGSGFTAGGQHSSGGSSSFVSDPQLQALLQTAGLQPLPAGQAAVQAMASDPSYQMLKKNAPILGCWESTGEGLWQAVIDAGYLPCDDTGYKALAADIGMPGAAAPGGAASNPAPQAGPTSPAAPTPVKTTSASQLLAQLGQGGGGPAIQPMPGAPGVGMIKNPTPQDIAALTSMVSQHGTTPQGLQAIMSKMSQNAAQAPAGAHPIQAGLGTAQPHGQSPAQGAGQGAGLGAGQGAGPGPRLGAGAFSGPTWLFKILDDPDLDAVGLTSVVIVSAAKWRATHTRHDEEITDHIGDDLPESLIEDDPSHFVSEDPKEEIREALMATGIFAEDRTIG